MTAPTYRRPYVGEGADGCRRSAEIDRTEAEGMDVDDPRRDAVLASVQQWSAQAAELAARDAIRVRLEEAGDALAQALDDWDAHRGDLLDVNRGEYPFRLSLDEQVAEIRGAVERIADHDAKWTS